MKLENRNPNLKTETQQLLILLLMQLLTQHFGLLTNGGSDISTCRKVAARLVKKGQEFGQHVVELFLQYNRHLTETRFNRII